MNDSRQPNITQILMEASAGDRSGLDRLLPTIYDQLRQLAQAHLANERPGHTLQATALVHEAYIKLVNLEQIEWQGRAHFFGAASRTIRRILVDHARGRDRKKRGGGRGRVEMDTGQLLADRSVVDIVALDEAMDGLAKLSDRQAQIVEMRVFGGLTNTEVSEALDVSLRTVEGDWSMAKTWLRGQLTDAEN